MFEEQAKQELFEKVKALHACKKEEGQSVSSCLLKIKSYLDTLERLGYAMPNELGVSLILNSLNKDYDQFVQNYNMHSMGKTIAEVHAMLKLHEKGIPKKAKTPGLRESKSLIWCFNLYMEWNTTMSREGASYFITFTDDLSRYGYVYLMKHKHEVTFKVFQNEVENQLGKKIKGYALESAARILYMVPTKKAERTPYEIWHGKAPKLSYLRLENNIFVAQNDEFFENSLVIQEANGSHGLLEPNRYGFYVDVEEYELGDLNKPPNYKAALSDLEFDKWLEAMNTKMQSMKDN
ncbi:hypothetical protein Tco_0728948 [Tanacetum coccineum]|uniref:Retrotransposon protein, putative, Ty1-copia subclass n=1 Tax=Tanacetum coccineum TaxID=301880 RepID=A0ABQ4YNE8_9ASTR